MVKEKQCSIEKMKQYKKENVGIEIFLNGKIGSEEKTLKFMLRTFYIKQKTIFSNKMERTYFYFCACTCTRIYTSEYGVGACGVCGKATEGCQLGCSITFCQVP